MKFIIFIFECVLLKSDGTMEHAPGTWIMTGMWSCLLLLLHDIKGPTHGPSPSHPRPYPGDPCCLPPEAWVQARSAPKTGSISEKGKAMGVHPKLAAPAGIWWAVPAEGSRYLGQKDPTPAGKIQYPCPASVAQ